MATQVTQTLPAKFVEDLGTDLATQVTAQTGIPIVTQGVNLTRQTGETAEGFKKDKMLQEHLQQDNKI